MLSTFFPPRRLDPVLDGGVGAEGAVVPPEVPAGVAVGQAVFGDQTDGTLLDAAGVKAVGQSQVGEVTGEATAAAEAAMAGESDQPADGVAAGAAATARAGSRRPVATATLE